MEPSWEVRIYPHSENRVMVRVDKVLPKHTMITEILLFGGIKEALAFIEKNYMKELV